MTNVVAYDAALYISSFGGEFELSQEASSLNLSQYHGLWSIDGDAFRNHIGMVSALDWKSHLAANPVKQHVTWNLYGLEGHRLLGVDCRTQSLGDAVSQVAGGKNSNGLVMEIVCRGAMTKQGSSLSDAGSTVRMRQAIREAATNEDIAAVLFTVETPGGTSAGTDELASEIWDLSQQKPTVTFAEDMMASAGLWAFSQSNKVFANSSGAIIGSHGTYMLMLDSSAEEEKAGRKWVLVKTGDLKGGGVGGLPITDAVIEQWQSVVDAAQENFTAAYARARKPTASQSKELMRGGVFSASDAERLGIIDGVRSKSAAFAELRSMVSGGKRKGSRMASETNTTAPAATVAELKQAFPKASAEFILSMAEGKTMAQAQSAWASELQSRNEKLESQLAELNSHIKASQDALASAKAEHEKAMADLKVAHATALAEATAKAGKPKFPPHEDKIASNGDADGGTATAKSQWDAAIKSLTDGGMTKQAAVSKLARERPELHKAYIEEVNSR